MIQHKLGLPIVQLFLSGSLIPPKVQFWGRDDCKTSKLQPQKSCMTLKKNNIRLPKNRLVYNEYSIINYKIKIKTYFNEDIFPKSDK